MTKAKTAETICTCIDFGGYFACATNPKIEAKKFFVRCTYCDLYNFLDLYLTASTFPGLKVLMTTAKTTETICTRIEFGGYFCLHN